MYYSFFRVTVTLYLIATLMLPVKQIFSRVCNVKKMLKRIEHFYKSAFLLDVFHTLQQANHPSIVIKWQVIKYSFLFKFSQNQWVKCRVRAYLECCETPEPKYEERHSHYSLGSHAVSHHFTLHLGMCWLRKEWLTCSKSFIETNTGSIYCYS